MARRKGKSRPEETVRPQPEPRPADTPWRIRFAQRILADDVRKIGHAALELARTAIDKNLKVDPEKAGQRLRSPLHGLYKLTSSHIRIAYHVEKTRREVWILMIGDRRDIWDEEQSEILERLGIQRQQADRDTPG